MRKIFSTALCTVVAMSYFVVNSSLNAPMSELIQTNVKALAVNEEPDEGGGGGGKGHWECLCNPEKNIGRCNKLADGSGYACMSLLFGEKDCYTQIVIP